MYKALYRNQENQEYWRTLFANDLRHAMTLSKRYARKGYYCVRLQSDE